MGVGHAGAAEIAETGHEQAGFDGERPEGFFQGVEPDVISTASDGQLISTLQDIRNGRRTEIETLFELVRIAETLGRGDLVQETRLLGELTKLKADRAQRNGEVA